MLGDDLLREALDCPRVFDVEGHRMHALSACDRFLQRLLAPTCDDHGVSERIETPRQFLADARPAAGYENCVACRLHLDLLHLLLRIAALLRVSASSLATAARKWSCIHVSGLFYSEGGEGGLPRSAQNLPNPAAGGEMSRTG